MDIKCTQNIFKSSNGRSNVTVERCVSARRGADLPWDVRIFFTLYGFCQIPVLARLHRLRQRPHWARRLGRPRDRGSAFLPCATAGSYLIQDMQKLTDIMQVRYPDLPYFVLGHSMGSLITPHLPDRLRQAPVGLHSSAVPPGPIPLARPGARMGQLGRALSQGHDLPLIFSVQPGVQEL